MIELPPSGTMAALPINYINKLSLTFFIMLFADCEWEIIHRHDAAKMPLLLSEAAGRCLFEDKQLQINNWWKA